MGLRISYSGSFLRILEGKSNPSITPKTTLIITNINYFIIYCNDKHEAATNILLQLSNTNYFTIYFNEKYETIIYYNVYIVAIEGLIKNINN